ncbi:MAG TPA: hypothetical protein VHM19_01275, partial [Polyangiales bacterium]|nr:hypothetical protein [Polyangiales bacterium]
MTTGSIAPRSLAPVLPPRAAAQTRVKALAADLALAQTPLLRAALEHEMAALTETRLGNASAAMQHYESAAAADPSFRPALFALWRILRERGNDVNDPPLARLLEALVRATPNDVEGASLLVELGVHLEDRLGDASGARLCFEQALARDPSSRAATLMLERVLRAHGDVEEAARIGRERATHTTDAALRSTLLAEAAEAQLRHGEIDEALAALLAAAEPARELSPRRFAMLERTLKVARGAQRFAVAAQVLEEMAELVARATDGSEPPGAADLRAALPAWSEGASAAQYRAWLLREAGRLRLSALQDPTGAAHAYDAAAVVASDDELLLLERLSAYESAGRIDDARAHLARLLELAHSDPARTTLLQFQRAELAARAGDRAEARAALRSALDSDPETPAVLAVLEDALLDDHAFAELCDHLQARAAKTTGAERRALLLRAAQVAADRARNPERALMLYHRLVTEEPEGPYTTPLLREAHAVALRADHTEGRLWAARALLARGLDDAETSALLRDCYEAELARNDVSAAHTTLRIALEHAACETWAPFGAALVGALRGDQALLAIAHAKLGEHQTDVELAAAHACAQARALWRGGDTAGALRCAERAL